MAGMNIIVSLLMNTGSFVTDTDKAAKQAKKKSAEIADSFKSMAVTVGAAFAASTAALALMTKNAIDGLDALNDVADATGASVENISALEDVALRTGTTLDNVSGILVKFNNALKEAKSGDSVSESLKAIGLSADELKKIDPAEALRLTAVALAQFADDGNKARLVQDLFGRSIKEAAPFLKDLAEQQKLVATTTGEQTQAAEDFKKSIFGIQANLNLLVRDLSVGLLPTLNDVGGAIRDLTKDQDAMSVATNTVKALLEGLRVVFQTLAVIASDVVFVFQGVGREIGAIAAQIAALSRLDFKAFNAISEAVKEDAKKARKELDAFQSRILGLNQSSPQVPAVAGSGSKPSVILPDPKAAENVAKSLKKLSDEEKANAEFVKEAWSFVESSQEEAGRATNQMIVANHRAAESYRDILDPARELNREIREIQALIEAGALTPDEGLAVEIKKINDFYGEQGNKLGEMDEFAKSAARNIQTSFADFLFDPFKDGVGGMLEGFLNAVRRMVAEAAAAQLARVLLGNLVPGGEGSGVLGNIFSSFLNFGGARAAGGPVAGGSTYLVGERGPELFTPNTSGAIIPNNMLGGGGVSVNVSVDASGTRAQGDNARSADLGRMIGGEIRKILIQEQRPGGLLA